MLIKQAITILLKEDPGIAALIGTRIHPGYLPQTVIYPAIAWRRKDRKSSYVLGSTKPAVKLITTWFEFACWAQGQHGDFEAEDLDDALFDLLDGYAGVIGDDGSPEQTLTIQGIFHEKLAEGYSDTYKAHFVHTTWRVEHVRPRRS